MELELAAWLDWLSLARLVWHFGRFRRKEIFKLQALFLANGACAVVHGFILFRASIELVNSRDHIAGPSAVAQTMQDFRGLFHRPEAWRKVGVLVLRHRARNDYAGLDKPEFHTLQKGAVSHDIEQRAKSRIAGSAASAFWFRGQWLEVFAFGVRLLQPFQQSHRRGDNRPGILNRVNCGGRMHGVDTDDILVVASSFAFEPRNTDDAAVDVSAKTN